MKRMNVCATILCLVATGLFGSLVSGTQWEYFERFPPEKVESLREDFKDVAKLDKYLRWLFWEMLPTPRDVPMKFKQKFDVDNEALRTVLTGIVRECSEKAGWKYGNSRVEDSGETNRARSILRMAITWMCACTDAETKKFLLDTALDSTKDRTHRAVAAWSYLHRADVQETKDFFTSLLADEARLPAGHSVTIVETIEAARKEMDEQKREAVDAALRVIKAREEKK
jgi:hypothetical protein